ARRRARGRAARGGACRVRTERRRRAHRVVQGVRQRADAPGPNRHGGEPDLYGARPRPRLHQTARRAAGREGVGPRGGKGWGEGDTGPNTGGMGAYCPVNIATAGMLERVRREVLEPAIRELAAQGAPFQGVLYAGLMLAADGTLAVLEFNSRFGDPEAQALLPLLPGVTRHLADIAGGSWRPRETTLPASRAAVATVLAASGYPERPELGAAIVVPRDLEPGTLVFHAGTERDPEGGLRVHGGRVLTVTGLRH